MRPRVIVFITGNAVVCKNHWDIIIVTGNRKWKGVSERVLLIFLRKNPAGEAVLLFLWEGWDG